MAGRLISFAGIATLALGMIQQQGIDSVIIPKGQYLIIDNSNEQVVFDEGKI